MSILHEVNQLIVIGIVTTTIIFVPIILFIALKSIYPHTHRVSKSEFLQYEQEYLSLPKFQRSM